MLRFYLKMREKRQKFAKVQQETAKSCQHVKKIVAYEKQSGSVNQF